MTAADDFSAFVTARHHALLRTAVLLTGSRSSGEDLLQEALARTFVAWERISDRGPVEPYVRRVMTNTYISWWRRRPWRERSTETLPEVPAADTSVIVDERAVLWPHLLTLPRRQRAVLVLRFYEDLTEAQIAEILGCAVGTVKSQSSRGLATLRRRIRDTEPWPADPATEQDAAQVTTAAPSAASAGSAEEVTR